MAAKHTLQYVATRILAVAGILDQIYSNPDTPDEVAALIWPELEYLYSLPAVKAWLGW